MTFLLLEGFPASTVVTVIAKKQHKNKVSNFFILLLFGLCCKDIKKKIKSKFLMAIKITHFYTFLFVNGV